MSVPKRLLVEQGHDERSRMWHNWDVNGNGILSVAEIDKRLVEKASYDPEWKNVDKYKQSIRFALNAADINKSGFIERREFRLLLVQLDFYSRAQALFNKIDTNSDHRIDSNEFKRGASALGIQGINLDQEFSKIDRNHGGFILFDEFALWLSKTEHPDIDQLDEYFKVEKVYRHINTDVNHEVIKNKPSEHVPEQFHPKINNIDEHLTKTENDYYKYGQNDTEHTQQADNMNLYTTGSPRKSPELKQDTTEYYQPKNPFSNVSTSEANIKQLVSTLSQEDISSTLMNKSPTRGRRLSQDLKLPYRKKHHFYTRKLPSNAKPEERKLYEFNKKIYEGLDKDVKIDIEAENDMQDKLDQLMEEMNIDYRLEAQKLGKTQQLYYTSVPEVQIKKRARRMSAAMREYRKDKYKTYHPHQGVVKK